ncbi:MAG: putative sulfate exporter family transporter [Gammaproteobacteria bacterium]|nr:putative sulfate exporter family transporter [Gammaproteobacteria bacterium]
MVPLLLLAVGLITLSIGLRQTPLLAVDGDLDSDARQQRRRFGDFLLKEDWWAIWLGVGLVGLGMMHLPESGVVRADDFGLLQLLALNPGGLKWSHWSQLTEHFLTKGDLYLLQFFLWSLLLSVPCRIMGISTRPFLTSFTLLYLISIAVFAVGGWVDAPQYNLEPPLVALIVGLVIANTVKLPPWLSAGFRVEFYVKTGIVLLGATFPLNLVVTAGPVAIGQATIVSIIGCLTIYFVGTRFFALDRRLAAVLSVGGSVCGVSASMAIAAAVGAKKEHIYTSVTLVVVWALVMILFLPFVSKALDLHPGVAGAWIGTSEFADAAGFAAASTYGKMAGDEEAAIKAFTLMKVIGRDLWIGIWALVWAIVATTVWRDKDRGDIPQRGEIWRRFPKFVIGFFIASLLATLVSNSYSATDFVEIVKPHLLQPIAAVRGWVFIFCFLSIGLTTRFRDLKAVNMQTITPFSIGVIINVIIGFILSVYVFGDYWSNLS